MDRGFNPPGLFHVSLLAATAGLLFLGVPQAHALKDSQARQAIEELRTRIDQVQSNFQARQMGLGEQIQAIREEVARLESKIGENRAITKNLSGEIEVGRIETQETFVTYNHAYEKRFKVSDENLNRLHEGIGSLQKNIKTLSDNLQALSEFEKKQEARISLNQESLQKQLEVIVEEVGKENLRLQNEIAEINKDIYQFQELINTVDGRVRNLSARLDRISQKQRELSSEPAASEGGVHVVSSGETLSLIAAHYGVTVQDLLDANQLPDANVLHIGQELVIPGR